MQGSILTEGKKERKKERKKKRKKERKKERADRNRSLPQSHAQDLFVIRVRGNTSLRRRITESSEKLFDRPLQSASTSARLSERIRRRPDGYRLSAYRTAYKMERASRIMIFSSREKPPYPKVATTPQGSLRVNKSRKSSISVDIRTKEMKQEVCTDLKM